MKIDSQEGLNDLCDSLQAAFDETGVVDVTFNDHRARSLTENAALHVYCRQLAEALNDAGYDMKHILDDDIDIPWSQDAVKRHLWKVIQNVVLGKVSTTKVLRGEYKAVYDVLNRHLGEKYGVSVPWPSRESQNGSI